MPGKISMLLLLLASRAVLSVLAVRIKSKRVASRNFSEERSSMQRNVDFTQTERHLAGFTIHGDDQKGASPQPTVIGAATWLRDTGGISRTPPDQGDLLRFDPEIQEAVTYLQMSERLKIEKKTDDAQFEEEWDKLLPAEAIRLKSENPASALTPAHSAPSAPVEGPDLELGLEEGEPTGVSCTPTEHPLKYKGPFGRTRFFTDLLRGAKKRISKNKQFFDLVGVCCQQFGVINWNNMTFEGENLPAPFEGVDKAFFDGVGSRAFMEMVTHTIEISLASEDDLPTKKAAVLALFVDMIGKEVLLDRKDCCEEPLALAKCNFCTIKCFLSLAVLLVNAYVKATVKDHENRVYGYAAIMLSIIKDVRKAYIDMRTKENKERELAKWQLKIACARAVTFVIMGVVTQRKDISTVAQSGWKWIGEIGEKRITGPADTTDEKKEWIQMVIDAEKVVKTGEEDMPGPPTALIDIQHSLEAGEECAKKVAMLARAWHFPPPPGQHEDHIVLIVDPVAEQTIDHVLTPANLLDAFLAQDDRFGRIERRYVAVKEKEEMLFKGIEEIQDDEVDARLLQICRIARLVCKNLNYPVPPVDEPPPIDGDMAFALEVSPTGPCVLFHEQPSPPSLEKKVNVTSGTTEPSSGSRPPEPDILGVPSEVNLEEATLKFENALRGMFESEGGDDLVIPVSDEVENEETEECGCGLCIVIPVDES